MDKYLKIQGYKCFLEKIIPINQLTVLAGGNSVGKSSVIQALLLMRSTFEREFNVSKKIPLNGEFALSLGNSSNVVGRKYDKEVIGFEYRFGEVIHGTHLRFDPITPELYLTIENYGYSNLGPLSQENFHYLHAERLGPRSFYQIGTNDRNVGWQGEYAVPIIASNEAKTFLYNVNEILLFSKNGNPSLKAQVELWMDYIIPGIELDGEKIDQIGQALMSYNNANPYNVGFGISYVLPIIVAGLIAKKGEMLIVENPEAHLHPSGQSRIGQFLARVASIGVQVITETHSEHVINGIRLACLTEVIPNDEVVINFFSPNIETSEPNVKTIYMNENADLEEWPKGFFDQTQHDLATIFRIKRQKNKL